MTCIHADCPTCGRVHLHSRDVALSVCCDDATRNTYAFTCPSCAELVVKAAPDPIVCMLVSGGVRALVWNAPLEADEPHTGPRICLDDLIDLHAELERL